MPPAALSAWTTELARVWPDLSRPQIKMLAQYSMGMILAESCGLSRVAICLSQWLGEPLANVRERLRDLFCARRDKSGHPLVTGKDPRPILSVFVMGLLLCRIMLLTGQVPLNVNLTAPLGRTPRQLALTRPTPCRRKNLHAQGAGGGGEVVSGALGGHNEL